MEKTYHLSPSTRKECEEILKSIDRQVFYMNRLLGRVLDLKREAAGLDSTYAMLQSGRGYMREAHEALHLELHGVCSGKYRHQRDVANESKITGEKNN